MYKIRPTVRVYLYTYFTLFLLLVLNKNVMIIIKNINCLRHRRPCNFVSRYFYRIYFYFTGNFFVNIIQIIRSTRYPVTYFFF